MIARGEVRAAGATIDGILNLKNATIANKGGMALTLDRIEVKGHALLNHVTVTGEARADGASINNRLDLTGATLMNEDGDALVLQAARLSEVVLKPAAVKGGIMLQGAQITVLRTPEWT